MDVGRVKVLLLELSHCYGCPMMSLDPVKSIGLGDDERSDRVSWITRATHATHSLETGLGGGEVD